MKSPGLRRLAAPQQGLAVAHISRLDAQLLERLDSHTTRRQLVLALERIGSCHGVTTENAVNGARIKAGLFQAILDLQDEVT